MIVFVLVLRNVSSLISLCCLGGGWEWSIWLGMVLAYLALGLTKLKPMTCGAPAPLVAMLLRASQGTHLAVEFI